jgi:hypothetical protein
MEGFIPLWFSDNITKIICIVMAISLSFNLIKEVPHFNAAKA